MPTPAITRSRLRLLLEQLFEKGQHPLPGSSVGLLLIGQTRHAVTVSIGIGETMPGTSIEIHLPIHPGIAQCRLERFDSRGRDEAIGVTMRDLLNGALDPFLQIGLK